MCGIVGYIGPRDTANIIISGLHRLEYRGYDSAGIALCPDQPDKITVVKAEGKISNLENVLRKTVLKDKSFKPSLGIGHTRWATHGEPNQANAHPHLSRNGEFAIVHNGIIENYADLKTKLIKQGYEFKSDTDSEVIANLIEECYEDDLRGAVAASLEKLEGTYGIAVISSKQPDTIVAARKGSPIAIGICDKETIIASDISALVSHTKQVVFLDDGDILTATSENVDITSLKNVPVSREMTHIDWDIGEIEKGGYEHFMLKEINEQPNAIANASRGRLLESEGTAKLSGMQMDPYQMARIERIAIAACGTSYHAGMVGKYYFEDFAHIPTEIQQSAEFRDRDPIILKDTCMLAISQSGETADTLTAVREAKRKGAMTLGICNVVGSTIARETGRGVYIHAGPEIGVASTKAFTCQVTVLAMMAITFSRTRHMSASLGRELIREISRLPEIVQSVLGQESEIKKIAKKYAKANNFFYIGRGYMYPAALEGALKLKEISYAHAEGYHAAELKHGPIALLEENVPVVVCVPDITGKSKTIGNMQECRARKSPVIAIATENDKGIKGHADDIIRVPACSEYLTPIPVVIATQLFAYHVAKIRGCSIDQPRNLAKSVTVE
ncbi:glutamine--fructose-6-phosphate transaminase (isomerizing) [Verrucomicrobiota bacterium]